VITGYDYDPEPAGSPPVPFDFARADALVGFAARRFRVVGHCLVWAKDDGPRRGSSAAAPGPPVASSSCNG
jgi:hypothetical protein